jgi:hypothetical protein
MSDAYKKYPLSPIQSNISRFYYSGKEKRKGGEKEECEKQMEERGKIKGKGKSNTQERRKDRCKNGS